MPSEITEEKVEELRGLLAQHGPLSALEAHRGDDYACLMFPDETTDTASVYVHGEAEVLVHLFAAAINLAPALLDTIVSLQQRIDAAKRVIEIGYDRPGINPIKGNACEHGRHDWQDCIGCYDETLLAALGFVDPPSTKAPANA